MILAIKCVGESPCKFFVGPPSAIVTTVVQAAPEVHSTAQKLSQRWLYVALAFIVLAAGLIRFRLREMPLERDEGEYAYAGQLILQGVPPYELVYNMKLPGTYMAYALILEFFGQTPVAIHWGLILINLATIVLVLLLTRQLFDDLAGIVAAASYALLSTSPSVLGFAAHATHFVVLFAVSGLLVLLRAIETRKTWLYLSSGILLGIAFLMKQPGILFVLFAGLYVVQNEKRSPADYRGLMLRVAALSAGVVLPFGITCLWLACYGLLGKFWFWTFVYAGQYASSNSWRAAIPVLALLGPGVVGASLFVWLIAGLGLTALFWDRISGKHALFAVGFLVFSFLAVCPGFYFRAHYFILMLPAVSLFVGVAVSAAIRKLKAFGATTFALVPLVLFVLASAYSLAQQRSFLFLEEPVTATRKLYAPNPFAEAPQIADYIRKHTSPQDRIAVLGSEPEIYFYTKRRSASGYIYAYELMEEQQFAGQMQEEAIQQIEAAGPEYIVNVNVFFSWFIRPKSDTAILQWGRKYMQDHYDLVGVVDLLPQGSQFYWDDAAKAYHSRSANFVEVFRRK